MASTPSTRRQHDGVAVWFLTDRFSGHDPIAYPTHWLILRTGLDVLGTAVRAARATAPRRRKTRGERSDSVLSAPRDGEEWGLEIT